MPSCSAISFPHLGRLLALRSTVLTHATSWPVEPLSALGMSGSLFIWLPIWHSRKLSSGNVRLLLVARNHRLNPTPLSAPDGCSHEPHSHQPVAWLFPWLPSLWRTGGTKPPYEKIIPGQTWIPMRRFDRCEVENCPVSAKGEATTYHRTSR